VARDVGPKSIEKTFAAISGAVERDPMIGVIIQFVVGKKIPLSPQNMAKISQEADASNASPAPWLLFLSEAHKVSSVRHGSFRYGK